MNEKIRELAEESGITDNNLSDGNMSHNDLKKFAELIVKESCELFTDPYEAYSGAYIHLKINQHFGVEE
jgi:hypothetical protein